LKAKSNIAAAKPKNFLADENCSRQTKHFNSQMKFFCRFGLFGPHGSVVVLHPELDLDPEVDLKCLDRITRRKYAT
jgi:hypothetical protein